MARATTPFLETVRCSRRGHIFELAPDEVGVLEDTNLRTAELLARKEGGLPEVSSVNCPECQRNRARYHFVRSKKAAAR